MAIYIAKDIYTTFDGDISVGSNGDVRLGDSYESHKSAVNFLIRTDKGEYQPDKRIGCNLGVFIGDHHTEEMHQSMEDTIKDNISKFVLAASDMQVHVMPLSETNAGVFLIIGGQYSDLEGSKIETAAPEILVFDFPYSDGEPRLVGVN